MLNYIQVAEYRQIVVELLTIVSTILLRNPELIFNQTLDLEQLVTDANHMYAKVSIYFENYNLCRITAKFDGKLNEIQAIESLNLLPIYICIQ